MCSRRLLAIFPFGGNDSVGPLSESRHPELPPCGPLSPFCSLARLDERERERRHSNFQTEKIVQKRKQIRTSSSSIPSQNHHPTNRSAVKGPPSVCVFPRRLNGIRSRLPPRRLDRIRLRLLRRFDGIRRCACCERQLRSRDPLSVAAVTVLAVILPSCSPRWRRQGGWGERESRGSTTRVEEKVSRERPHGDLSRSCPWRRGSFPARLAP